MEIKVDIKKIILSITTFLAINKFSPESITASSIISRIIEIIGSIGLNEKSAVEQLKKVLENEFSKLFDYLEPEQCQEIISECFSEENIEIYLLKDEREKLADILRDSILEKVRKNPEKYNIEDIRHERFGEKADDIINFLKTAIEKNEVLREFEHRIISSHTLSLVSSAKDDLHEILNKMSLPNSAYLWNTPKHGNTSSNILKHLHYSNDDIELYDRAIYLELLRNFCGYDRNMKIITNSPNCLWWIITGKGGVGKSKLAYEFSKEMHIEGWTVCYPPNNKKDILYKCSESLPNNTLFILDYTESDYVDIGEWLVSFSANKYKNVKVRILLLQRFLGKVDWLIIHRSIAERNVIRSCAYQNGEPLEIDAISDIALKEMMCKFAGKKVESNEMERLFETLCKIDHLKRPLFALAIVDAYMDGKEISKQRELLDYLCEKEIEVIHGRIHQFFDENVEELCDVAQNIYIMATMVGKFSIKSQISTLLPDDYSYLSSLYYKKIDKFYMETKLFDNEGKDIFCEPIEPDIIGEAFVLNYLDEDKKLLLNAWKKPYYMSRFVTRLYQDFEDRLCEIEDYIDPPILPEEITELSEGAFFNCTYLKRINLPDKINFIGNSAFRRCINLASIRFPQNIEKIGDFAFKNCRNLTRIELPEGLKFIGKQAFCGCSNLIKINLPDSLAFLGDFAFSDCKKLTSIKIPEGLININIGIFKGCDKLDEIELPLDMTAILNFVIKSNDEIKGQVEYWNEEWEDELWREQQEEELEVQLDEF